jgi:hypothetical protein
MSWGSSSWGDSLWGSGEAAPAPDAVITRVWVDAVRVWAADLIEVTFTSSVRNNGTLRSPASYTIAPHTSGNAVTIREVRAGSDVVTPNIFLVVTPPDIETVYDVAVIGDVRAASGDVLVPPITGRILMHRTKIDSVLTTRTSMYDLRPAALFRSLMNAIGRQDHLIGGNIKVPPDGE